VPENKKPRDIKIWIIRCARCRIAFLPFARWA
jgi:hypothetical protein